VKASQRENLRSPGVGIDMRDTDMGLAVSSQTKHIRLQISTENSRQGDVQYIRSPMCESNSVHQADSNESLP